MRDSGCGSPGREERRSREEEKAGLDSKTQYLVEGRSLVKDVLDEEDVCSDDGGHTLVIHCFPLPQTI